MTEQTDGPTSQSVPIDESLFSPVRASREVLDYVSANPELNLESALGFLLDTYPQVDDDGQTSWLLDGGAAVKLLAASDRTINDIDLVTRRTDLSTKFANSGRFDAKDIR